MIGMLPAFAGLIAPRILKPVFVFLILVASPIGMIMGELAMLAIFFGMVLPIGLLLRSFQRAPLELDLDRDRESYWENKERSEDAATYYRQS